MTLEVENMLQTLRGIYREGRVELAERPRDVHPPAEVLVTFLANGGAVDLAERGISPAQAAELRARLKTFAADWERPEMDAYDDL